MAFVAPIAAAAGSFLASGTGIAALTAATAGITALSSIQAGNYQAAVARNNARIAEENAARTSEASQREAARSDQDYRALLGEQLAAQGASGFDILGRSARSARQLTQRTGRRAAMDITTEGEAGARRSLQEAANFRGEGRQARLQGYVSGASALLQGASDVGTLVRGRRPRSFERRSRRG
jgi:hypothetical protein